MIRRFGWGLLSGIWKQTRMSGAVEDHRLFLKWLIFAGVVTFTCFLIWRLGLLGLLFSSDKSFLSLFILLLFAGTTLHCSIQIFHVSKEINLTRCISEILEGRAKGKFSQNKGKVLLDSKTVLPSCVMSDYITDLIKISSRSPNFRREKESANRGSLGLLESYEKKLKNNSEIGWFLSDLVLKIGLLGTVVGFIIMLSSVSDVSAIDAGVMQDILTHMSGGMGVALYTTMTGLICGALLGLQYHFLDRGIENLVAMMVRISEVQVTPRLGLGSQSRGSKNSGDKYK